MKLLVVLTRWSRVLQDFSRRKGAWEAARKAVSEKSREGCGGEGAPFPLSPQQANV